MWWKEATHSLISHHQIIQVGVTQKNMWSSYPIIGPLFLPELDLLLITPPKNWQIRLFNDYTTPNSITRQLFHEVKVTSKKNVRNFWHHFLAQFSVRRALSHGVIHFEPFKKSWRACDRLLEYCDNGEKAVSSSLHKQRITAFKRAWKMKHSPRK